MAAIRNADEVRTIEIWERQTVSLCKRSQQLYCILRYGGYVKKQSNCGVARWTPPAWYVERESPCCVCWGRQPSPAVPPFQSCSADGRSAVFDDDWYWVSTLLDVWFVGINVHVSAFNRRPLRHQEPRLSI
jgi:hypothetical protein